MPGWATTIRRTPLDVLTAGAAFAAAPISIAVAELLLGVALALRLVFLVREGTRPHMPQVFAWWSLWAAMELVSWLYSTHGREGAGEVRHLLLIGCLFLILPALWRVDHLMGVWRGIFLAASLGSVSLVCGFAARAVRYHREIAAGGDPAFYLRTGGFLHHWMIYSVVEVLLFGAILEFRSAYPAERWWTTPALAVNCLGICFSLTRSLWLAFFILLGVHLVLRRPKAIWVLPAIPAVLFLAAPGPFKIRAADSLKSDYYSNAERLRMWQVGSRMIHERPITGVGAGRIEGLYRSYLSPGAVVPAYHGHLHNDALQLAAQFGLPVLAAALLCVVVLLRSLLRAHRRARDRDQRFLCRAALMGVAGFLIVGLTDYAYGHSLGLILFSFVAISPLVAVEQGSWPGDESVGRRKRLPTQ